MKLSDIIAYSYISKQVFYALSMFAISLAVGYSIFFISRDRKASPPIEAAEKINDISSLELNRRLILRKNVSNDLITCIEPIPTGKTFFISSVKEKFITTSTPVARPLQEIGWSLCIAYVNGAITKDQYASSLIKAIDLESLSSKDTIQNKYNDKNHVSAPVRVSQMHHNLSVSTQKETKDFLPNIRNICPATGREKRP